MNTPQKFFGEFLVEKGIINDDELLDLIFEQITSLPSAFELVYREKWLAPQDILKVLKQQVLQQKDFKSACIHLGLWDDQKEMLLQRELQNRREPIGEMVLRKGKVDAEKLAALLKEYSSLPVEQKPPPYGVGANSAPSWAVAFRDVTAEELILFEELTVDFGQNYSNLLKSRNEKFAGDVVKIMQILESTARLTNIESMRRLAMVTVDYLRASVGKNETPSDAILNENLKLILSLRESILKNRQEKTWWSEHQADLANFAGLIQSAKDKSTQTQEKVA